MQIATVNERVAVTDAQTRILILHPRALMSVMIQNLGGSIVELGAIGLTYGEGYQLGVSEILGMNWDDFPPEVRATNEYVEVYAICDTGGTASVQVWGFARRP
jgi:hypothetical protein